MNNLMRPYLLLCLALLALAPGAARAQPIAPSGLADIDSIRSELRSLPTDADNFVSRQAALFRWWRLLWRQGYDLSEMNELAGQLTDRQLVGEEAYRTVDAGYTALERLHLTAGKIPELRGTQPAMTSNQTTDWPYYFGGSGRNDGHSPDPGPTQGVIDWRFPKGYASRAAPVVAGGLVYLSSPGIDVNGFCLDERSGEVRWRSRQMGTDFYGDHGSRWSPQLTERGVIIRNHYDEQSVHVYNRTDGKPLLDTVSEPTDRQYVAYTRNGKQLVVADARSGKDRWVRVFDHYLTDQPVVEGNKIYLALRNGEVWCMDTEAHGILWRADLGDALAGNPTVTEAGVFVGSRSGKLYALNPLTGATEWTFTTPRLEPRAQQFFTGVLQHGERLYFGAANKELYCTGLSGELQWKLTLDDWLRARPIMIDDILYVVSFKAKLHALRDDGTRARALFTVPVGDHPVTADLAGSSTGILVADQGMVLHSLSPTDGTLNWRHGIVDGIWRDGDYVMADWAGGLLGSPTVVDGVAYIGGPDGFVNAVDVDSGMERWRFETNSTVSMAPTVVEGKVFFGYLGASTEHYGYDNPGEYYAVDKDTGSPVWSSTDFARVWVSAAYAGGVLCFGNTDGFVYGVDPGNGQTLWSYNTAKDTPKEDIPLSEPFRHGFPSGVYSIPLRDERNFYVGSWSGYYFALDQQTGAVRWRTRTAANDYGGLPDSAAPMLHDGYLYVQLRGGAIGAIDVRDGSVVWEWKAGPGNLQNATVATDGERVFGSRVKQVVKLPYASSMLAFSPAGAGGQVLWEQPGLGGLTAPVLTGSGLVTGSSTSMFVTGLDAATGELRWRVFTGGEMLENVPAVYGNRVLLVGKNGYLFAIK